VNAAFNHCVLEMNFVVGSGTTTAVGVRVTHSSKIALSSVMFVGETSCTVPVTGILADVGTIIQNCYWNVNWSTGTWVDTYNGTFIPYVYNASNNNLSAMQITANGFLLVGSGGSYGSNFEVPNGTAYLTYTFPNATGTVLLQTGTATTATAGSGTLPAKPAGFIEVNIGGTTYKIPYYNS